MSLEKEDAQMRVALTHSTAVRLHEEAISASVCTHETRIPGDKVCHICGVRYAEFQITDPFYEQALAEGNFARVEEFFRDSEWTHRRRDEDYRNAAYMRGQGDTWRTTVSQLSREAAARKQLRALEHTRKVAEARYNLHKHVLELDEAANVARNIPDDNPVNSNTDVDWLFGVPNVYPPANKIALVMRLVEHKTHPVSPWSRYRVEISLENRNVVGARYVQIGHVGVRHNSETLTLEGDGFYNYTSITVQGKVFADTIEAQYGITFRHILPLALGCLLRDVILKRNICDEDDRLWIYAYGTLAKGRDFFSTQVDLVRYYESIGFFRTKDGHAVNPIRSRYPLRNQTTHIAETVNKDVGVVLASRSLGKMVRRQFRTCEGLWEVSEFLPETEDRHPGWKVYVANAEHPAIRASSRTHEVMNEAEGLSPRVVRPRLEEEIEKNYPPLELLHGIRVLAEAGVDLNRNNVREALMTFVRILDADDDKMKKKRKTLGEQMRLLSL